jgi:hypothetical protein
VKEKDPKGMSKTLMPLTWVQKPIGSKNLEEGLKAHLWA